MKDENTFAPLPEHARNILDAAEKRIRTLEWEQRLCLDCKHFWLDNAMPNYSEYTPGHGMSFECEKHKWKFDHYADDKAKMKGVLETARECHDFERT